MAISAVSRGMVGRLGGGLERASRETKDERHEDSPWTASRESRVVCCLSSPSLPLMTQEPRRGRSGKRLTATVTDLEVVRQKAYLIGLVADRAEIEEAQMSLRELASLSDTDGSDPVGSALVRRARPDPALLIGSGKAEELASETQALDVDVVIFDNELTPAQQRNLRRSSSATLSTA